ncbi:MAG: type I glutamate--ammonia ligase [Armatimonadota bacterium]|nr:type I glutamate--ammonia ligase [Armatimonadota bacterium]MDR7467314.1 type I glutamate--ammonia ligase [Armatimonadota bacterium]MDR7494575.1 type I glutamate--ammonia ligase [Armatimonadota bacterium]MDR7500558.1 type I glutamate--ammonia ligase [Armatimonadota bacterium]MDR7505930.1 type I glutamate--ammonia ligase [Armatimonadota bacterium]
MKEQVRNHISDRTIANPSQVIEFCRAQGVQMVDFRFTDLPGTWQHFSAPVTELDESMFVEGVGFDGSSIRGFQHINESDMILLPDAATATIDPLLRVKTLLLTCDVYDPVTRARYTRDPRYVAQKAERYLAASGIATTSYWGPEAEFFVFDDVRYHLSQHEAFYAVDSAEGIWNSGRDEKPNLGHKPRHKEGYFPAPPADSLQDFRSGLVLKMQEAGIDVEVHHHEVASAGQCEIDMRFSTLTDMGDKLMLYKYLVKMYAREHFKTATFMPKPIFGDNGSGMHCHQSLWKDGINLFFDPQGYAQTSQLARWYIGGLLAHSAALMAFCAPTTNSYRRLVPGYEAPVNLVYSMRNRSAAVRIPVYSTSPRSKRIEYRPPDGSANPYLAFAAMLMAGLDGIRRQIDPGDPMDVDLYELPEAESARIRQVPGSLDAALAALEADHAFLLEGEVFTKDLIETWIEQKRKKEVDFVRMRPHPAEFHLYYDV